MKGEKNERHRGHDQFSNYCIGLRCAYNQCGDWIYQMQG